MIIIGGFIKVDVERVKTTALNTKVNKEVFDGFKKECKRRGYSLNTMLEIFMGQYVKGRFHIDREDILKFKNDDSEMDTLNTTFSEEIYTEFKKVCKRDRLFIKHVITAFMEKFASGSLVPEFTEVKAIEKE